MTNGMPPDAQRTPLPHDEVMRRLRAGLAKYKASHPAKPKKPDTHVHLKDELTPEQMKALRRIHFQHVHDNFIRGRTKVAKPKKTPQEVIAAMHEGLRRYREEYRRTHPKPPPRPKRTPEELAAIRRAAGERLKAINARRRALTPPKPPKPRLTPEERRAKNLAALAKAHEVQRLKRLSTPPKPPKPKLSPEERRAKSLAALAKAREVQRLKHLNAPPKPPSPPKPKLSTVALHDLRAKLALNMVAKRTRLTPKPVAPLRPALFASAHETAHSPYTFRWQHRTSLKFRVWPVGGRTRRDIATIKELPITGFEMNSAGKLEAWHKIWGRGGHRFELSDEDAELLALAGGAGVRILTDRMVLHAPGPLDEKVKKEYWLEIPVSIYPASPCRSNGPCKRPRLRNVFGPTAEEALDANGIKRSKVVLVESMNDVDEEVLAREVVENDAVVVFLRDDVPAPVRNGLVERSAYWVVPGRRPDEDGGAFRGYQFHDRLFRWIPRYGGEDARRRAKERLDRAHATVREKGRNIRRAYLVEHVVTGFAERVGMSRQRVMSRFLEDGVLEWLTQTADRVTPVMFRETKNLMRTPVRRAVAALEFFYRATEELAREGGE